MVVAQRFEIRPSRLAGLGCFATAVIEPGEFIWRLDGPHFTKRQMIERIQRGEERTGDDPLQIGPDLFMDLDEPGLIFNHSCDANAALRGLSDLVAFRRIEPGDEICYDYSMTVPSDNDWFMSVACRCSAENCRGKIGNWKTVTQAERLRYINEGFLQDFIRRDVDSR